MNKLFVLPSSLLGSHYDDLEQPVSTPISILHPAGDHQHEVGEQMRLHRLDIVKIAGSMSTHDSAHMKLLHSADAVSSVFRVCTTLGTVFAPAQKSKRIRDILRMSLFIESGDLEPPAA
jgi:hypothetical protein